MKVLGINASPRNKGNTRFLMSAFMKKMQEKGYDIQELDAFRLDIKSCIGCGNCEKKGVCIFTDDDFTKKALPQLEQADIVVLCSPVYFYAFPADVKALIDRIQVLWSRKYRLKTGQFKGRERKGILLAIGATKGKDLFDGMKLTARYFFDAADIAYAGELCYRGIDEQGEMANHPTFYDDVEKLAAAL